MKKTTITSEIKYLSFELLAGQAIVAPPLSTTLGNMGLRTAQFCDEFNELTSAFPKHIKLNVFVLIKKTSRNWTIILRQMPIAYVIQLCSKSGEKLVKGSGGFRLIAYTYIDLSTLYKISIFFFNSISFYNIKNLIAIVGSTQMEIKYE